MGRKILAINPGSTSTKIAVYEENKLLFSESIRHSASEIAMFNSVFEQYSYRYLTILNTLRDYEFNLDELTAVVGRGGMLRPLKSGTYHINRRMIDDLQNCVRGEHASNLGAVIAKEIGERSNITSFIVDPVAVDEMDDIARYSGLKEIQRDSLFHALNQKAVAKRYAKSINTDYNKLNIIVAHLGGGISVGAHHLGRVIDVNNALDGDGPFSPERSGSLPLGPLYKMCFSGAYTLNDIKQKNYGKGGLVSYLGTNNGLDVLRMIESGDIEARNVFHAMAYQISQEIAKHGATLKGQVDAIILTGGLAHLDMLNNLISERVSYLAKIIVYPGEDEMIALVEGALRVLDGEEEALNY